MSHLFALFLVTSIANIVTPGLGVAIIVLMAAEYGWRKMFWGSLGIAVGIAVLFTIALSGVGVVIAASPALFALIKLAGALYIFFMAWQTWRKPVVNFGHLEDAHAAEGAKPDLGRGLFWKCVVISLTNPQPIVFGVSVLPQFIDPAEPYVEQAALMIVVYSTIVFVAMELYAMAASRARVFLAKGRGPLIMKRVSAAVFVLIGLAVLYSTVSGLLALQ